MESKQPGQLRDRRGAFSHVWDGERLETAERKDAGAALQVTPPHSRQPELGSAALGSLKGCRRGQPQAGPCPQRCIHAGQNFPPVSWGCGLPSPAAGRAQHTCPQRQGVGRGGRALAAWARLGCSHSSPDWPRRAKLGLIRSKKPAPAAAPPCRGTRGEVWMG